MLLLVNVMDLSELCQQSSKPNTVACRGAANGATAPAIQGRRASKE